VLNLLYTIIYFLQARFSKLNALWLNGKILLRRNVLAANLEKGERQRFLRNYQRILEFFTQRKICIRASLVSSDLKFFLFSLYFRQGLNGQI